jgi:uncharacterized protein YegL
MPRTGARGIENELARRQAADSGETPAPLRTAAEIEGIKKTCQAIISLITGGKNIPLNWVPGQGFFWTFPKPGEGGNGTITGDSNDLERKKSPNYVPGVIFHESRHVAVSQPGRIPPEIWNKLGGAIGYNWFDDNRVENRAGTHIADGDKLVGDHLAEDIAPFGGLDYQRDSKQGPTGAVRQKIGYIPKHMVLGAAARQYFYLKEYAHKIESDKDRQAFIDDLKKFNQEVGEAFERMLPDIEAYYQTSPRHGAGQAEIDELSEQATQIYVDKLWPEYQKLVEQSRNDQTLKDFIDKLIDGAQFAGQDPQGGGVVIIDFDSLPPDIQDEIKKKMQGGAGGQGGQPQGQGQPGEAGQPGGQGSGGEPSASPESGGQPGAGGQGAEKGQPKPGSQPGEGEPSAGQGSGKPSVPWDKLSPAAQKAAKEAFDKLKPGDKAKIKEEADGNLGEAEDAANEELGGHSNTDSSRKTKLGKGKPGSGSGQGGESTDKGDNDNGNQDADQSPDQTQPKQPPAKPMDPDARRKLDKRIRSKIDQILDDVTGNAEKSSEYHDIKTSDIAVRAIQYLVDKFMPIFRPELVPEVRYSEDPGGDFDVDQDLADKLDRREPAPYRIEGEPTRPHERFTFLVDLSGSMAGEKIRLVRIIMVILNEVMTQLGIDCAIIGYPVPDAENGIIKVYRDYNKDEVVTSYESSPEVQGSIVSMLNDVGGGTPTDQALSDTLSYVVQRETRDGQSKSSHHFIMLWTDGQPDNGAQATKKHIGDLKDWLTKNFPDLNIVFTGLGVGEGTKFINDMFDRFPADLRRQIATILNGRNFMGQFEGRSYGTQSYDPELIDKSYTLEDIVLVLPVIIQFMIENPEQFANQSNEAGEDYE